MLFSVVLKGDRISPSVGNPVLCESTVKMPTNIEIKSLLKTDEYLEAIENAKKIYNGTDTFELYQKDTFFNTSNGTRLKLRCERGKLDLPQIAWLELFSQKVQV